MYDLNVVKEIKVTDSYMGLDEMDRQCQNNEKLQECKTKQYVDALLNDCGCLPLSINILNVCRNLKSSILMNKVFLFPGPTLLYPRTIKMYEEYKF